MKKMKMMRERQTHMVHKRRVLRSWIQCNTNTNEKDENEDCFPCTPVLHGEEQLLSNTAT